VLLLSFGSGYDTDIGVTLRIFIATDPLLQVHNTR
jgi:hypothetical protein